MASTPPLCALVRVFEFQNLEELVGACTVCKAWNRLLGAHDEPWKGTYKALFCSPPVSSSSSQSSTSTNRWVVSESLLREVLKDTKTTWRELLAKRCQTIPCPFRVPQVPGRLSGPWRKISTFIEELKTPKRLFWGIQGPFRWYQPTPRNRPWAAFPFLLRDSTPLRLLHHLDYLTSLLAAHTANATASSSKSEAIFPKVGYFEVAIGAGSVGVVGRSYGSSGQFYGVGHVGWRPTSVGYHSDDGGLYYNVDEKSWAEPVRFRGDGSEDGDWSDDSDDWEGLFNFMDPGFPRHPLVGR
uniref:F-box domain-containing protein n=1 Tax=Lotharella globosa TaxID=91324 RepID=A0A6V3JNT6_9EUKA